MKVQGGERQSKVVWDSPTMAQYSQKLSMTVQCGQRQSVVEKDRQQFRRNIDVVQDSPVFCKTKVVKANQMWSKIVKGGLRQPMVVQIVHGSARESKVIQDSLWWSKTVLGGPIQYTAVHEPSAKYYQLTCLHGRWWRKWRKIERWVEDHQKLTVLEVWYRHIDLGTTSANSCLYSWTAVSTRWSMTVQGRNI